ncbi:MAG: dienelactone hydrolase family protein [Beijerinckiaceae bacterium]|nr:dienelactone hydrolase family protein [Beijerinckiaceae bacterium]
MKTETIAYAVAGLDFEGVLVFDDTATSPRPLLLMAPNWAGVTPRAVEVGKELAAQGYVVFVADMHGLARRPAGTENPMEFLKPLIAEPQATRDRVNGALEAMTKAAAERKIGTVNLRAAIGYCFGGANVIDLARSGADVAAVVSMHGNLKSGMEAKAGEVKASLLVVHGAQDPIAPKSDRDAFEAEMTAAGADWTMLAFGGVYHSFTDPTANRPPSSQFSSKASRYGYGLAHTFIADAFAGRN